MLRKVSFLFFISLAFASCEGSRLIFNNHHYSEFPNLADKYDKPAQPPDDPSSPKDTAEIVEPQKFYFVTLEYPPGYDWIEDARSGTIEDTYLVVYQNFEQLRRVEVSSFLQVPSQPDYVFLQGGDLYTVFPDGEQTVVKRNGEHLFTIPAKENVSSLLVIQDDVYTLGYNPKRRDVSYRKNGTSVIYVSDASIVHPLCENNGRAYFSYVVYSDRQKYYYCIGEMSYLLFTQYPISTVYDLQVCDFQPLCIYKDESCYVWYESPQWGGNFVNMAADDDYLYDYDLFVDRRGEVCCVEHYRCSGWVEDITVWGNVQWQIPDAVYGSSGGFMLSQGLVVVYRKKDDGYCVASQKEEVRIPQRFDYFPQDRGCTEYDGEVYTAFSTKTVDGESIIQIGRNRYKSFRFNGYILAVEVGN